MSSVTDYNSNYHSLRTTVEVDNAGLKDYTSYLQDYSLLTTLSNENSGFISTRCDINFKIVNPDSFWLKQGLKNKITLSISSDEWASRYDSVIFQGSTSKSQTFTKESLKLISESSQIANLNQPISNFTGYSVVLPNIEVTDAIRYLLGVASYDIAFIDLTPTSLIIPFYYVDKTKTIFELINELAKVAGLIITLEEDGKIRNRTLLEKFGATLPTPSINLTRSKIKNYLSKTVQSSLLFNKILIKGKSRIRLVFSGIGVSTPILNNQSITAQPLAPYETKNFFITFPQKDLKIENILDLEINSVFFNPITFKSLDDGTGTTATASNITINSFSNLGDTIVFRVTNNNASTWYWKGAKIWGSCVYTDQEITSTLSSTTQIANQGRQITYTIESDLIQSQTHADYLANQYFNNFVSSEPQIYSIEVAFRPDFQIGKVIQFEDKDGNSYLAQIIEIDADAKMGSSTDGLFMSTLTLKKILT